MQLRKFGIRFAMLIAVITLIYTGGCSSPPVITRVLPENIMVHPPQVVGVVSLDMQSPVYTALRALGVRYHRIPLDSMVRLDRYSIPMIIMDENLLDDERVVGAYQVFMDHIRKGVTLLMLRQNPETLRKLTSRYSTILPRQVEYSLHLVLPRPEHPAVTIPNRISQSDLDSLSLRANQLALGDRDSRAMISANLQSPDSSATLLFAPGGIGAVWYLSVPIAARAAAGYPAEQKLLANLLSYDASGWNHGP